MADRPFINQEGDIYVIRKLRQWGRHLAMGMIADEFATLDRG